MTTPLPTPPNTIRPETFAAEMDDFLGALPTFQAELDALGSAFALSVTSTSATSLTVGTGSQSLTVQAGKGYVPGMDVVLAYTTTPTIRMTGTVTSYNATTGALVLEVPSGAAWGSGTCAAWSVSILSTGFGMWTELEYTLTGTVLSPTNGTRQTATLAAPVTYTETLSNGQSLILRIDTNGHAVTWPTVAWIGGTAPTLTASAYDFVLLWKTGGTLYGCHAGAV